MRFATSFVGLALVLSSVAAVGCTSNTEETETSQADITARLPPANAAPVLDAEELAFVKAMNEYRKSKGLEPFQVAIGLVKAARGHSQELAELNAPKATHNDRGLGDEGPLKKKALKATRARVNRDYPMDVWGSDATPGPGFGEDCKRRADIGNGAAAFAVMRDDLAEAFGDVGFPMIDGFVPPPNMLADYYSAIGVARARSSEGIWYWTVDYGMYTAPEAPMLSLDDDASQSLLANGSFEEPAVDPWGNSSMGWGSWSTPGSWYAADPYLPYLLDKTDYRALRKWHRYASTGGSVDVRADNAYFIDDGHHGAAHGLRIVDAATSNASASATQIVKAVPGVNYELTARVRGVASSQDQQFAYLDFTNEKFERIAFTNVKSGTQTSWTGDAISVSATAPPKTAYARIILFASGGSGTGSTFDWDDVRLRAW
ncbi:MAG: hypothetical protein U0270_36400 [Labilithrix sp.]